LYHIKFVEAFGRLDAFRLAVPRLDTLCQLITRVQHSAAKMPLGSTTEQHSPPLERQMHDEGESISNFQPTQTPRARVLATLRTISWHLLPIFCLLNCLNYLDRSNLSFALIQMSQDLNLTQEEYGIGAGLFFVGYTTCQIPSQLVLQHIGAPNWLGVIVTVWGVIACFMAAVRSPTSFYVVRLMLGAAEAGSFPGSWYYLTKFYPDNHIALPYSITDSAIMVSQVRSPFNLPLSKTNARHDM
jgi:hypothetical protein